MSINTNWNVYRLAINSEYRPNCTDFPSRISKHPPPSTVSLLMIAAVCGTVEFLEPGEPTSEPKDPDSLIIDECLQLLEGSCSFNAATEMKCPREDVTFWLYNRDTYNEPVKLDQFNVDRLKKSPFVNAPLKVLVHGYMTNHTTAGSFPLVLDFLMTGQYNVIAVDWGPLTGVYSTLYDQHCYFAAVDSVPNVAHCVATFINDVRDVRHFPSVHLLGYSLGAHVCLQASNEIPHLHRVTTFDPAGPLFEGPNSRYVPGTADIIDSYHTTSNLGRAARNGDVDVYFNNGKKQPGCGCNLVEMCSHGRAIEFFAEGLHHPEKMVAFKCEGWSDFKKEKCPIRKREDLITVGLDLDSNTRGVFMMITIDKRPFFIDPKMYTDQNRLNKLIDINTCKSDLQPVMGMPMDKEKICLKLLEGLSGPWP